MYIIVYIILYYIPTQHGIVYTHSHAHNIWCVYIGINTVTLLYWDMVNDKRKRLHENFFGESENSVCG